MNVPTLKIFMTLIAVGLLGACTPPPSASQAEGLPTTAGTHERQSEATSKKAQPATTQAEQTPPAGPLFEQAASPDVSPEAAPSDPLPEAPPAWKGPVRFWVADHGLAAYNLDGKRVATLGRAKIEDARRLQDGRIVALDEKGNGLSLLVLDSAGKVQRRVNVPNVFNPQTCAIGDAGSEPDAMIDTLSIQQAYDFEVGPDSACLTLQDRNDNMLSYRMFVVVGLTKGEVHAEITSHYEGDCEGTTIGDESADLSCGPRGPRAEPWVEPALHFDPPTKTWPFSFDEDSHWVAKDGVQRYRLCRADAEPDDWMRCSSIESVSPSGRWMLLSGRWSEGDYIHRDVVLLDRANGKLLQVRLDHKQPPAFIEVAAEQVFAESDDGPWVLDLVGESDHGWLPDDRLWVDGYLLIPAKRKLVKVGGHRVWTRP